MFVELIELLRCPAAHEESPLIATAERTESRHIIEGLLGCPVCGAEFRIANGIAVFGNPQRVVVTEGANAGTAMRLAAFLELTDAKSFAILIGTWCAEADQIRRLSDTPLVLVNPPVNIAADVAAVIQTSVDIPFARGSARGVALDAFSEALVESATRTVRPGGRVVGAAALAVPPDVGELVRDDRVWVGEKTAASSPPTPRLVAIKRAPPSAS